jgi:hypothetical protein
MWKLYKDETDSEGSLKAALGKVSNIHRRSLGSQKNVQ